jgi:prepilin-type N-terminal cleavage/methylation domain-containing protein
MRVSSDRNLPGSSGYRLQGAFTLTELMIAMSIFLMVVGGVVAANFFGIRMLGLTQPVLGATGGNRDAVSDIVADISSAKILRIGTGSFASFTALTNTEVRQGNAIQLYPSNNTNSFVRYYRDGSLGKLMRMTNGASTAQAIATGVTNAIVFAGEDALGNVLNREQNNMVIRVTLQYSQLEGSGLPLGPDKYFKAYEWQTRVTRRSW